jgi:hypothetical protein
MVKIRKIFALALALVFGLLSFAQVQAAGNAVTFSENTTIHMTGSSVDVVILNGSQAASYVVGTTTIIFNLETGSSVTVRSNSKYGLTNTANKAVECGSNYSQVSFVPTDGSSITVTPGTSDVCVGAGSGGGGTGGGGGGGSVPATVVPATPTTTTGPTPTVGNVPNAPGAAGGGGGAHVNGTLVLDGKTVYLIKDGQKVGFRNPDEYKSYGYNFSQAVPASAADQALPTATAVNKALEGTLVLDAADNKTVYMVGTNGTKRGFATADAFKQLGYSFANLPKINLSDYQPGPAITSASDSHPEGALVLEGKTVWWVKNNTREGFESMAVFNTYGFATTKIVKSNTADLALPQGPLVKFRDGTLVKDGSTYYLISDGKKLPFASTQALTSLGYKTSNAITGSLTNYEAGNPLQ